MARSNKKYGTRQAHTSASLSELQKKNCETRAQIPPTETGRATAQIPTGIATSTALAATQAAVLTATTESLPMRFVARVLCVCVFRLSLSISLSLSPPHLPPTPPFLFLFFSFFLSLYLSSRARACSLSPRARSSARAL